ncbi:hypothetical protein EVAR_102238_1 [Eumeta japonica]|uniref:Uncharacterized protein n=1 Tax=Eumeta variegata TaxID=151549 RepID=A0A4C1WGP1_EUMVA|nr:hypothetical protein EVAR_102238_1 [Eumeta japonica]
MVIVFLNYSPSRVVVEVSDRKLGVLKLKILNPHSVPSSSLPGNPLARRPAYLDLAGGRAAPAGGRRPAEPISRIAAGTRDYVMHSLQTICQFDRLQITILQPASTKDVTRIEFACDPFCGSNEIHTTHCRRFARRPATVRGARRADVIHIQKTEDGERLLKYLHQTVEVSRSASPTPIVSRASGESRMGVRSNKKA